MNTKLDGAIVRRRITDARDARRLFANDDRGWIGSLEHRIAVLEGILIASTEQQPYDRPLTDPLMSLSLYTIDRWRKLDNLSLTGSYLQELCDVIEGLTLYSGLTGVHAGGRAREVAQAARNFAERSKGRA